MLFLQRNKLNSDVDCVRYCAHGTLLENNRKINSVCFHHVPVTVFPHRKFRSASLVCSSLNVSHQGNVDARLTILHRVLRSFVQFCFSLVHRLNVVCCAAHVRVFIFG